MTEEEIVQAMRLTWERAKFLIEPSSAVAVAAVLTTVFQRLPGMRKVGIVLSGGNVDPAAFAASIESLSNSLSSSRTRGR